MNLYEKEHNELMRHFGAECAVLLKSDGAFPLCDPGPIALYGSGARRTVKGGTGSGEVNARTLITIEDGLEATGFSLTTKRWLEEYDRVIAAERNRFAAALMEQAAQEGINPVIASLGAVMPEPEYNISLNARDETVIYVLSRFSGEGADRKPIPGDILLTESEKRDILFLNQHCERFMLVLNVGGVVDLSPVMELRNILLLGQLGAETGHILADLLLGKAVPSGKLTTTWSAWNDYPQIGSFGEVHDTEYREGIYVGYRYFDSMGVKPLFPFGFGLSYTTFTLSEEGVTAHKGFVSVRVSVTNAGSFPGKEVAQLYASVPTGKLDQPFQTLAAFAKTEALQPGEKQELTLSFDLRTLASYDEGRACWALNAGDIVLRLGNASADTKPIAVVRLDGEVVVRQCKRCLGKSGFADWKPEQQRELPLLDLPVLPVRASDFETEVINYETETEIDPLIATLSDEELCFLNMGAFDPNKDPLSVIGDASRTVAGAAGETTGRLKTKGIPAMVMADGPAGLRLSREYTVDEYGAHPVSSGIPESMQAFGATNDSSTENETREVFEQYCTALPIGTALAQSWNLALAERCGDVVGDEMERFGVHLWLAPALNIHRDIRCGRNFEYYSEDPLISGRFAAAVTRGVQHHPGCGATVKHFAANNQETNRYHSNSRASERALRELYLRGFEIAVKESQPYALMSSYNLINGVHTAERRDLIEDLLRAEFGFRGIVMTDWIISILTGNGSKYPAPDAARIAAAGNDLMMPGGQED